VVELANHVFAGRDDLVLLELETERIPSRIVEERSGHGQKVYPHVYDSIPYDAIVRVHPFPAGPHGDFRLPASVANERTESVPQRLIDGLVRYEAPIVTRKLISIPMLSIPSAEMPNDEEVKASAQPSSMRSRPSISSLPHALTETRMTTTRMAGARQETALRS
jgi:hypothetical protein